MTFSWLGFIVGFLSGVVWCIVIAKITEFIRFISMAKYQAKMKVKESEQINELTSKLKETTEPSRTGDKEK